MTKVLFVLIVIFGACSLALAQATTQPVIEQPTTMPVQEPIRLLVVPFKQIGPNGHEWVGSALHENLVTEAAKDSTIQVLSWNQGLTDNTPQGAIAAAKKANATLVVYGSYQFASDDQLRICGQILDANYGRTLAALKATGTINDLFRMEDTIADQLNVALPEPVDAMPAVTYGSENPPEVPQYYAGGQEDYSATAPQPSTVYVQPPTDYGDYYDYGYPYYGGYPYYYGGYGYPYFYGGYGGFYNRGGFGRGGFHGGFPHGFGGGRPGFSGGFHGGGMGGGFHGGGGMGGGFHGGGGGGGHGR
jgi:TolB-like protein